MCAGSQCFAVSQLGASESRSLQKINDGKVKTVASPSVPPDRREMVLNYLLEKALSLESSLDTRMTASTAHGLTLLLFAVQQPYCWACG